MDDWLAALLVIAVPVVTIASLGFVVKMMNRSTTVFQRDANGNIVAITTV